MPGIDVRTFERGWAASSSSIRGQHFALVEHGRE
jgi:hypothetical protein